MEQQIERQTAYKIWLSLLNNKPMTKQEGEFSPNYIEINDKKITRVNIIANIVQINIKEDNSFASMTIDDGSAQIRVKAWQEDTKLFSNFEPGQTVLVFGKLRDYNNELYLTPEIIKKQSLNEFLIRQNELIKEYGKPVQVVHQEEAIQPANTMKVEEEKIDNSSESKRQLMLNAISSLDTETGASLTEVISKTRLEEKEADQIINELLQEGEIFKISSDRVKVT